MALFNRFMSLRRLLMNQPSSSRFFSAFPGDDEGGSFSDPPLTTSNLFISGLSRMTTDEKLKEAFSPFGRILEAKVIMDRVTGRSKGFGFVRYATVDEACSAREGMNAKFLDGWVIFVDPAKPKGPRPPARPPPPPPPEEQETGVGVNKTIGWCG
ncbi:RNA-binding (RRM/RBD/RNP motifs) family protein [Wolffia australiana]